MLKIKETRVLMDLKRLLEIGEYDLVLIPCDILQGVFVCLKLEELRRRLAKLSDWKNIRNMNNNVSIRIWANRFPYQSQFFVRKTVKQIVEQIKTEFCDVEADYLPLPKETRPA